MQDLSRPHWCTFYSEASFRRRRYTGTRVASIYAVVSGRVFVIAAFSPSRKLMRPDHSVAESRRTVSPNAKPAVRRTRILFVLGGVGATLAALVLAPIAWSHHAKTRLRRRSRLAETARGPIEYAVSCNGRPVVIFHATPG